jgi:GxxExxY protein
MKTKENKRKQKAPLSYKVIGICQEVQRNLGAELQEKYYQRALKLEFEKEEIDYSQELKVPLNYKDELIGYKQVDFLIEDKLILETKAVPFLKKEYEVQVLAYLNALQIRIGLLVNFRKKPLEIKRLILPNKYIKGNLPSIENI